MQVYLVAPRGGTLLVFNGQWLGNVQDSHQPQKMVLSPEHLNALLDMHISEKRVYETQSPELNSVLHINTICC